MTTHTTIPTAAVAAGGRPRGSLITALRDNLYAIIEGDPTAVAAGKQIARPALPDALINRAKLDATLVTQAFSLVASASQDFTLNPYCFLPGVTNASASLIFRGGAVSETPRVTVSNPTGGTIAGNLFWRYINA